MSLKKRIVSWYTLWTLFLMALIFLMFFAFSDAVSIRNLRSDIEGVLSDAADDVFFRDGIARFDELDEVEDGVYVFAFSLDGSLLFGRRSSPVESIAYQEGQRSLQIADRTWIVSDMMMDSFYLRTATPVSSVYAVFTSDYLPLLLIAPILVLISALGGYFIVKKAFRPLEDLIATASTIASGDDLNITLESSNTKEGKALSEAFNAMLSRLKTSFQREKEFSDDASHELRTPVAVIKAEAEYALSVIDDEKEASESLSVIIKESDRMSRLIDSLLTLARADKGTIKINRKVFSLSELANTVSESMVEIAEEKGVNLTSSIETRINIFADEDMITRAMINLIDNAISYSKEKGRVEVILRKNDRKALIEVKDDGIGISEENQKRIFDRFFQVDKSRTSSSSGLGLAMVKEIASLNGGSVSVESRLEKGSVFTLTLPLSE